jgi:hypothetical protein
MLVKTLYGARTNAVTRKKLVKSLAEPERMLVTRKKRVTVVAEVVRSVVNTEKLCRNPEKSCCGILPFAQSAWKMGEEISFHHEANLSS